MNQELFNRPKWNILAILIVIVIGTLFMVSTDYSDSEGIALLVVVWLPFMLGMGTLILYGLSRLVFKKYNWFITLLGALYILSACIQFYFG
tara:strand:+ start:603 stop:875 length:273 start_codon:yes stop_codon:yes gene_type:complete